MLSEWLIGAASLSVGVAVGWALRAAVRLVPDAPAPERCPALYASYGKRCLEQARHRGPHRCKFTVGHFWEPLASAPTLLEREVFWVNKEDVVEAGTSDPVGS
jgi:hypothetical protein